MSHAEYEFMGQLAFVIFIVAISAMFGYMIYDLKKDEKKH